MKVSIVTATFNSAKTVKDTIESVLSQTYQNFEHIIIDGGSRDETMSIVKSYEPLYNGRLRYISEPDEGIYNAMNKGLKMASGDIVGTLNSDDFYADNTVLESIVAPFSDKSLECIFGKLNLVDEKDLTKVIRESNSGAYYEKAFWKGWHPAHQTFYAKTDCYKKYGYFNETLKIASDFELLFRFLEKNKSKSKFIDKVLVLQRAGGASTRLSGYIKGNLEVVKSFELNGMKAGIFYIPKRIFPKLINAIKNKIGG